MIFRRPHFLVLAFCLLVPIAFATTYAVSVLTNNVAPDFPYISDTGTTVPAQCIFGQFLDIGAALVMIICYQRYLHVKEAINIKRRGIHVVRANKVSFFFGFLACFGVTVVGNFQLKLVPSVHYVGAALAFLSLLVYCWMQMILSHLLSGVLYSTKLMFSVRLIINIIGVVCLVMAVVFGRISGEKFMGDNTLFWGADEGGYVEHILSTSTEWAMAFASVLVILTFYPDFRKIEFKEPKVILVRDIPEHIEISKY